MPLLRAYMCQGMQPLSRSLPCLLLSLPSPVLLQRRDAELAELRGVVGALDAERDALQAELDRRAETAAAEAGGMAAERQRAEETARCFAWGGC